MPSEVYSKDSYRTPRIDDDKSNVYDPIGRVNYTIETITAMPGNNSKSLIWHK